MAATITTGDRLRTLSPREVDEELAAVYNDVYEARRQLARHEQSLEYARKSRYTRADELASCESDVEAHRAKLDKQIERTRPYNDEFARRGGWSRAFLVTSSDGGHVHSSMLCSTCRITTEFCWLPQYSDASEDTIVSDAGERVCTTCYPSAPVALRSQPTKIFSDAEREAVEARAARAAAAAERAAAKAAKSISMPDGSPVQDDWGWALKTVRSAEIWYVDQAAYVMAVDAGAAPDGRYDAAKEGTQRVLLALAHKHGTSVDVERERLAKKVTARVRRDYS